MQNSKKKYFLLLIIIFLIILGISRSNKKNSVQPVQQARQISEINYIKIAGKTLKIDLALTSEIQAKGLSGRNTLKEDEGMLFVFNYTGKYSFWMKDMNFSIDIIWIGEDLRVVYIKKDARPESYPEAFAPDRDAKYVLEVLSQFSEKNNLKEGDKVEFLSS
ncbi:MAG: DUF192 domain-containing protein [Candidatus Paceibacterota bacterium]|jgi:hypothetical protein